MKIGRTESGFTLLEGMIATVILSVGVIAMGAMQGIAITRNVDSTELTLATNMASEMLERIQYNRRNVTAYAGIDTNNPCVLPAIQTMAQGDCVQWQAMMTNQGASGISQASMLTGVRGVVTVTPVVTNPPLNQSRVNVVITWTGRNMGTTAAAPRRVMLDTTIAPE
ncbi:MAG: prepilin-type N-terminal cleavage/methylation domain-containing protein [Nitrospira sp.]|jgi:type IV pilus assembly protein PilV|nr:prepilin-type N-terminal cleavage/methylation domain-containing protein [Nitrospira sp.]MDH4252561.1 prepilin-type N-terminal cleavage/methylation domain-containing protein [Nitrospira sp.]MDH5334988.1 prepilin-type N-terminal cleavage/methylation domain-containing protein [Nitrospira sp.]